MGLFVGCVVGEDCSPIRSIENEPGDAGGWVWTRDAGAVAPVRDSGDVDEKPDAAVDAPLRDSGVAPRSDDSGVLTPASDSGTVDPARDSGTGDGGQGAGGSFVLEISLSGSGTTKPASGTYTFASGTAVQVTATPARGSVFERWSGAASGAANPVTVTMDRDRSLTANFAPDIGTLPSSCPGACDAAAVAFPAISSGGGLGNVTMYSTSASTGGACNYGTTSVMHYAAINVHVKPPDGHGQWQDGKICGQCAEVTTLTSQGPKTVFVRIMDKCEDSYCGINLAGSAPAVVMLNGVGRYVGTWRFASCDGHPEVSDGSPSLLVVDGSSRNWARVRVLNPRAAVESIQWQSTSDTGSFPYATDPENAFEVPINEVLQSSSSSVLITVNYTDGSEATTQLSPSQLATPKSSYPLK